MSFGKVKEVHQLSSSQLESNQDYDISLIDGYDLPFSPPLYEDTDGTFIAHKDDEILGFALYSENGDIGNLEYVGVHPKNRGERIGSALVDKVLEESEADSLYAQATSLNGRIQSMLQNRGFEASGFNVSANGPCIEENTIEGLNLNLWNTDDLINAYIPQELREFADNSLSSQRDINYVEPRGEQLTGSFEYANKNDDRLEISIGAGSNLHHHIEGAIEQLNNKNDYWASTVEVDTSEPVAYPILDMLSDQGFKPVDFSPAVDGQVLTMADLGNPAGPFNLTDETIELLETTGLDYEAESADGMTKGCKIIG